MSETKVVSLNKSSWYQLFQLPDHIISYYWNCIEQSSKDFRHQASGCLSKVHELQDTENVFIHNVFLNLFHGPTNHLFISHLDRCFNSVYPDQTEEKSFYPFVKSMQVNYQDATQYNPIHWHSGLFSFVIWMKIPFDYQTEQDLFHNSTSSQASFGFVYNNDIGIGLEHIQPQEGFCCLFPAHLAHFVYPFYSSTEQRISITGNIGFKTL